MMMLNKQFTLMGIFTGIYNFFRPRIGGMLIALLFLAIMLVSTFFTPWNTVQQLPQNITDQSNIQGIGHLIFTDLVVPFEILSIVLLASLIGAIYMAKGDGTE
jgi:F420H2 dehydrogenase subunit J